jgi:hypothetical protein
MSLLGFSDTLLYVKEAAAAHDPEWRRSSIALGPLYALQVAQISGTLALALWVLVRARLDRRTPQAVRRQITRLSIGAALMLIGAVAIFGNAYVGSLLVESTMQPVLALGALVMAIQAARYPGMLEGQLLRSDLNSSLLGTAAVMTGFVALLAALGAPGEVIAGTGWFVLAAVVFADELRSLAERAFFRSGSRAGRTGLRTAAAYAEVGDPPRRQCRSSTRLRAAAGPRSGTAGSSGRRSSPPSRRPSMRRALSGRRSAEWQGRRAWLLPAWYAARDRAFRGPAPPLPRSGW